MAAHQAPVPGLSTEEMMPLISGVGKESWESLNCKIKLVNPKVNQLWIFIGRTYVKAEAPILWPPEEKSLLNGKDSDAGKNWRQEKKVAEDKTVG